MRSHLPHTLPRIMGQLLHLYSAKDIITLREAIGDMSGYVDHKRDCNVRTLSDSNPDSDICVCGYSKMLMESKATYDVYGAVKS